METKTYTTIDRAALGWPAGPWDGEPDKMQWPDADTGLPCLAVRNRNYGNWCGYVGLPPEHPMYGKDCDDDTMNIEVHGGLTFADKCQPSVNESQGICHTPGPREPDHVWWLGFDCGHSWDFSPLDKKNEAKHGYPFIITEEQQYRTLAYVQKECAQLAAQLASLSAKAKS